MKRNSVLIYVHIAMFGPEWVDKVKGTCSNPVWLLTLPKPF